MKSIKLIIGLFLIIFSLSGICYSNNNIFYSEPNVKAIVSDNGIGYIDQVKQMSFLYSPFEISLIKSIEARNYFNNYNNIYSQLLYISWGRK
jgi:hypothetical protein